MKKKGSFLVFVKTHIVLFTGIIMGLVLPLFILLGVFTDWFQNFSTIKDFSGWASLVAGVSTYLGAAILGIAVFYNTWIQDYRKEKLDYKIMLSNYYQDGYANFYNEKDVVLTNRYKYEFSGSEVITEKKEYYYKRFVVKNYSDYYPIKIQIENVEMIQNGNSKSIIQDISLITSFNIMEAIEYNIDNELFLGINKNILKHWICDEDDAYDGEFDIIKITLKISNEINTEFINIEMLENDEEYIMKLVKKKKKETSRSKFYIHHLLS